MFASAKKVGSTATVSENCILILSHITFRHCRVHIFPTTSLEIAVYFSEIPIMLLPSR